MAIDVYLHIEGTEGMLLIDHVSLQFSKVKWKTRSRESAAAKLAKLLMDGICPATNRALSRSDHD